MEDDNGLELSLGLSFGGSSGKLKAKDVLPDPNAEEGSRSRNGNTRGSEVSLRNFFRSGDENHAGDGKQKAHQPPKMEQENFWIDLGKPSGSSAVDGASSNLLENLPQLARHQELWASSSKIVAQEDKTGSLKRKLPVEAGFSSVKNSRVLATTAEDGSTGENEDVADSEAEGSNSLSVSQRDGNARSTKIPKYLDKHRSDGRNSVGAQVQREPPSSANEAKHELGKAAYGAPAPLQSSNIIPVPYSMPVKATTTNTSNFIGFPPPCVMQLMPLAEKTGPMVQAVETNNVQLAFGYSPVQLPTLETNQSWAFASRPRHLSSFDRMDGAPNTGHSNDVESSHASSQAPRDSSPALENQLKPSDIAKGNAKPATDNGATSSYHADREGKGSGSIALNLKEPGKIADGSSREGSVIRQGMASDLKFGGSGSRPDLPWVSTTGPDGKTISGVTYKYDETQIRIVCACHGTHMSPEEFVQHASADAPNPEGNTLEVSLPRTL